MKLILIKRNLVSKYEFTDIIFDKQFSIITKNS